MTIYAEMTSERATKGQGGNKYLSISIKDANERVQAYIMIINDNGVCTMTVKDIDELRPYSWSKTWKSKGKKQKDEITGACGVKGHGTYCKICYK